MPLHHWNELLACYRPGRADAESRPPAEDQPRAWRRLRSAGRASGLVDEDFELLARVLGMPPLQVGVELAGRSVAELATTHGVPVVVVLEALVARSMRRIIRAFEAGRLPPELALEIVLRVPERAARRVYGRAPTTSGMPLPAAD